MNKYQVSKTGVRVAVVAALSSVAILAGCATDRTSSSAADMPTNNPRVSDTVRPAANAPQAPAGGSNRLPDSGATNAPAGGPAGQDGMTGGASSGGGMGSPGSVNAPAGGPGAQGMPNASSSTNCSSYRSMSQSDRRMMISQHLKRGSQMASASEVAEHQRMMDSQCGVSH